MFISAVPLFDKDLAVKAYLILAQKMTDLMVHTQNAYIMDGANHSAALDLINKVGLEALTGGLPVFVPINNIALLMSFEASNTAAPDSVVFITDSTITPEQMYYERLVSIKNKGYKIAIHNIDSLSRFEGIIKLCDHFLLNSKNVDMENIKQHINTNYPDMNIILRNIPTMAEFENYVMQGFDLYEGPFYRMPVTKGANEVSPLKANYIQLINTANDENFDIDEVAEVVQQDTALAISLLRLVNSLSLASEVKSITNAAALLGQRELRKWITTAVVSQLCADKPNEITRLSLIRAKFAEFIAPSFHMAINAKELFLMGLFSVLDIILEMPMERALDSVKVTADIYDALVHGSGKYAPVLSFVKAYEAADWQQVSFLLILHNISADDISGAYLDSLSWYSNLLSIF